MGLVKVMRDEEGSFHFDDEPVDLLLLCVLIELVSILCMWYWSPIYIFALKEI